MEKESKRLYRSETDQILGGVASGIADYLNIDPTIVRFLWVLVALLGGTGVFVYIVLWIIIPTPNQKDIPTKQVVEQNAKKMGEKVEDLAGKFEKEIDNTDFSKRRQLFGVIIILVGVWLLASSLGIKIWFDSDKFWPLILVIVGIILLFKKND